MNPYIAVSIVVAALVGYLLMDALFGGAKKPPEDLLSRRKDDSIEIGEPVEPPSAYSRRTFEEHQHIRDRIKIDPKDCDHTKGGRIQNRSIEKDYNVSLFIFIDGTQRVRCLTCGQKWFEGDDGWNEALLMTQQSTNRHNSSSEQLSDVQKVKLRKAARRKGPKPDRKWFRR